MKALKIIGIVILVLIVLIVLLGLIMPKDYHIERSAEIKAPQEMIFKYVKYFKHTQEWSPWKDYDPDMVMSYEGEDGTVGAKYFWEGNEEVGKGIQEITAIEEGKRVDSKLTFIEPFEAEDMAYIDLTPGEGFVTVTWGFDGSMKFPMNIMLPFIGLDKQLGPDLEKGLLKLKELTEKKAADKEKYGFVIHEFEFGKEVFLCKKSILKFDKIQEFFAINFQAVYQLIEEKEIETDGYPSGLYFSWDMENMITEMAAAVPVKDIAESPSGDFELISLEAEKALKIEYEGSYEALGNAYNAMNAYIKDNGLKQVNPVIEMYLTDPTQEPDTSKWLTNIIYLVE